MLGKDFSYILFSGRRRRRRRRRLTSPPSDPAPKSMNPWRRRNIPLCRYLKMVTSLAEAITQRVDGWRSSVPGDRRARARLSTSPRWEPRRSPARCGAVGAGASRRAAAAGGHSRAADSGRRRGEEGEARRRWFSASPWAFPRTPGRWWLLRRRLVVSSSLCGYPFDLTERGQNGRPSNRPSIVAVSICRLVEVERWPLWSSWQLFWKESLPAKKYSIKANSNNNNNERLQKNGKISLFFIIFKLQMFSRKRSRIWYSSVRLIRLKKDRLVK